jgi:hypothetical protein
VFSLGDILLTTGIGIFCYRTIMGAPAGASAPQQAAERPSAAAETTETTA